MVLAKAKALKKHGARVYVLACVGDRYYVGFSNYLKHRLQQHFDGFGAWYTRRFRPLGVIEVRNAVSEKDEFEVWKEYAAKYGFDNIGGYSPRICKALGFEWPSLPRNKTDLTFWRTIKAKRLPSDLSLITS